MIHATRSSTPLLLIHLPGGHPSIPISPSSNQDQGLDQDPNQDTRLGGEIDVEGAIWNQALGGPGGVLGGIMELRREIMNTSGRDSVTGDINVKSRVGLWYNGRRFTGYRGR